MRVLRDATIWVTVDGSRLCRMIFGQRWKVEEEEEDIEGPEHSVILIRELVGRDEERVACVQWAPGASDARAALSCSR